jgi:MFS family permease
MLAGLLPDIASDLDVTVGTAGTLTSAFAVGMIVGAPLVAALARNWPRRSSLLGFILTFAAAHAVGAITTSFPVLFATRVVAALANARFAPTPGGRLVFHVFAVLAKFIRVLINRAPTRAWTLPVPAVPDSAAHRR